jgi:3-hydroxybutyryl-CoA dehydratase
MNQDQADHILNTQVPQHFAPGYVVPPLHRCVTQDVINEYAQATGDFNPIHVDEEYSRTGPFGRTIAHGLMTLAYAAQMLNAWSDGAFDASGELTVAFIGPVFVGETVELTAMVEALEERDGVLVARCTLNCTATDRKIMAGTVHQPVPQSKET